MTGYRIAESIVEVATTAVQEAAEDYIDWTKGWVFPWRGPEYLYVVAAAQRLMETFNDKYNIGVFCEFSLREAVYLSRKDGRGRYPEILKRLSRPDMLISDGRGNFRMCLEFKRLVNNWGAIEDDVDRCAQILNSTKRGSIDTAGVIFFPPPQKIKKDGSESKHPADFVDMTILGYCESEIERGLHGWSEIQQVDGYRKSLKFCRYLPKTIEYKPKAYLRKETTSSLRWAPAAVFISN